MTSEGIESPLDLWPSEIWEKLFTFIPNSTDLVNIRNAHEVFARILDSSGPKTLFEKVLPKLLVYLESKDVLNCRQVCKKWDRDIVRLLESTPHNRIRTIFAPRQANFIRLVYFRTFLVPRD